MAFPVQFLDELRARIGLADTVGRRVRLQKRGREHVGLCPFHNEKSPSFTLNEDKGFFHCFGCGAHGDVIGFVMRTEGLSFPEAVERLAEQAGIPVPRMAPQDRERAEQEQSLYTVVEAACAWFEEQLHAPGGRAALAYLKDRGLTDETIARFRLGFAPDNRGGLKRVLAAKNIEEARALEVGLLRRPEGGGDSYDYFRGRILFPIMDGRGRVIAFGGRVMGDGQPKYLNSPENPLFHKGRVLFGLSHARNAAREKRDAVVVEGYMDVIALHQAGFDHAVAPLGTALTEGQIQLLWKFAPEPVLCFDGDAAGQRAMFRAAERALPILEPGRSLRFATLPQGEDPDTLVRFGGQQAMAAVLNRVRPLTDILWQMETAGRAADTPERRAEIRRSLLDRVRQIAERSVQSYYQVEMETRLETAYGRKPFRRGQRDSRDFRPRGRMAPRPGMGGAPAPRAAHQAAGNPESLLVRAEQGFLAAVIVAPALLDEVGEQLGSRTLSRPDLDRLRQELVHVHAVRPDLDREALEGHLRERGFADVMERVLSREVYEAAPFANPVKALEDRRKEWLEAWEQPHRREICTEILEDSKALGADMTPERWAPVSAKKAQFETLKAGDLTDEEAGVAGLENRH